MAQLTQSTAYTKMIMMVASSDSKTGLAGATLTITTSKAGAAFATITPTVTDRGNGWYSLALTTAHTDTLGELAFHITATSADPTDEKDQVIAQNLMTANVPANVVQVDGVANSTHAAGYLPSDVRAVDGTALATHAAGYFPDDLRQIGGTAVSATTAQLGVNVVNWNNSVVATPNTAGVPVVDDRSNALRINTAAAVAAGSITLDASASATDSYYNDCMIVVLSGTTGAGQARLITGYTGATKVATISPNWTTTPTGTVIFAIIALSRVDVAAVSGTLQTARDLGGQLDATTSSRMATFTLPTNFSSLAVTAGGAVTVGTNNDKTGYALTQTFPANFASMGIAAGGQVTSNVTQIDGVANATHAAGYFPDDLRQIGGAAVSATTAQLGVNVVNWNNSVVATPNTAGVPLVDDRASALRANTLQAATGSSATLDAAANATDGFYVGQIIVAAGQVRRITAYTGATKVATLASAWTTAPGAVAYYLYANPPTVDVGHVAGTAQTARDLGAQLDATISSRMATFTLPTNFNSLAITAGGAVTVGTNNDKTGYSLTQAFPTNFASLSITAGGVAQADLRSILGSALTGTAANIAASFSSFYNVASATGTANSLPAAIPGAANGLQICGTNAATSYSGAGITATLTGNLTGSVASVTGAVGSVTGNVGGSVGSVSGAIGSVTGNIGGNVTGSVGSVTAGVNVTQIEGADPTDTIRDSVYNGVVENSTTLVQFLRGIVATQFGKSNGMDTSTAHFRDQADTKNRVTATTDTDGNRSSITLDLS
jgi:hypothetical protein